MIKRLHKLAKLYPSFSPEVRMYQTLARVFDHVSKHLKLSLKNEAHPFSDEKCANVRTLIYKMED